MTSDYPITKVLMVWGAEIAPETEVRGHLKGKENRAKARSAFLTIGQKVRGKTR
jgi:hypothetical protein